MFLSLAVNLPIDNLMLLARFFFRLAKNTCYDQGEILLLAPTIMMFLSRWTTYLSYITDSGQPNQGLSLKGSDRNFLHAQTSFSFPSMGHTGFGEYFSVNILASLVSHNWEAMDLKITIYSEARASSAYQLESPPSFSKPLLSKHPHMLCPALKDSSILTSLGGSSKSRPTQTNPSSSVSLVHQDTQP